jgi:hypothetical protein
MLFKLRRMRPMDPLQVAMTGVRMGERYLQIFCSDATLTQGLATKTGLSGAAVLAAPDESHAQRARRAASKAGVLIDVQVVQPSALIRPDDPFDMVVIDDTGDSFSALSASDKQTWLAAARAVLRAGGRVELIERERATAGVSETALKQAGFNPVRTLAERDGFRFVEGLNSQGA